MISNCDIILRTEVKNVTSKQKCASEPSIFFFNIIVHYQRIAHRDIKPANLLLGEGRVQVADLGACGELAGAGRLTGAVGTPAFRAPEAAANADKYNGEVRKKGRIGEMGNINS